jgi:hypothetical protein
MDAMRSKSLQKIQDTMAQITPGTLRYHVLESAKNFKTSWIELGRALCSVWKDKTYKEWGYQTFEAYTAREIGIRKATALKLLRSYVFLEKEEPEYLKKDYDNPRETAALPSYEAVDILRLAKNKKTLDDDDYRDLKKAVLEKGKDVREVKKDLVGLIRARQELEPDQARQQKKLTQLKRLVGVLKSLTREAEISKIFPAAIMKDLASLVAKLEDELG